MFLPIKQTITIFQLSKTTKFCAKRTLFSYTAKFFLTKSHKFFHFPYILPPTILFTSSPFASTARIASDLPSTCLRALLITHHS